MGSPIDLADAFRRIARAVGGPLALAERCGVPAGAALMWTAGKAIPDPTTYAALLVIAAEVGVELPEQPPRASGIRTLRPVLVAEGERAHTLIDVGDDDVAGAGAAPSAETG